MPSCLSTFSTRSYIPSAITDLSNGFKLNLNFIRAITSILFVVALFLFSLVISLSPAKLFAMDISSEENLLPSQAREDIQAPQKILVSIRPYALILEGFIQNGDEVSVLVQPGASSHDFQLRPSHLKKIEQADLIVWSGEQEEPFLAKALIHKKNQLAAININGLDLIVNGHDHSQVHQHNLAHENHKQQVDPHIWFSEHNVLLIANAMADALHYSKDSLAQFQSSFLGQNKTIENKNSSATNIFKPSAGLIVYHNAYLYLEKTLGIAHDFVIRESHNSKPSLRHWQKLNLLLAKYKNDEKSICVVIMPGYQYSSEAKQFEKLVNKAQMENSIQYVELDPLASDLRFKNYASFLQDSKSKIKHCMSYK